MMLLAICGGLLLALALMVREYQLGRERAARHSAFEHLHASLDVMTKQLRRTREDLYVLRAVLQERGVVTEEEFSRSRLRLIENPRRRAEERSELMRQVEVSPLAVIVDEGESIH